jgi:AraC family transcriptional regulator
MSKATIVERDIINYRGALALKGSCIRLDETQLLGVRVPAHTNSKTFRNDLKNGTEPFILSSADNPRLITDRFYTVVACSGKEDGEYTVFCGRKAKPNQPVDTEYQSFSIPEGWYAHFSYSGDMFDIREVFVDDLYKWIIVKEAEINPNGIGMLNVYENDYPTNRQVQILVPIKEPV